MVYDLGFTEYGYLIILCLLGILVYGYLGYGYLNVY